MIEIESVGADIDQRVEGLRPGQIIISLFLLGPFFHFGRIEEKGT
jgi:hypothetical protein